MKKFTAYMLFTGGMFVTFFGAFWTFVIAAAILHVMSSGLSAWQLVIIFLCCCIPPIVVVGIGWITCHEFLTDDLAGITK